MGATTSKPGATRESLYELLQVSSDADSTALKKAYRKRALELHPDRNYENEEEATALFAKVQAAYDILTDTQERQWYDQHRRNKKYDEYDGDMTTAADVRAACADVLSKPTLDFELVASHFQKLKHEEQEAVFEQGISNAQSIAYAAEFGSPDDSWVKAQAFYNEWSAFVTQKTYAWEDIYPLHTAQDRRTRRKYEQANKKVRDAAKREFNAAVRQSVLLLRQRDPRRPDESTSRNKQKQDEFIAKEQAKRSDRKKQLRSSYADQDWQQPEGDSFMQPSHEKQECVVCESEFDTEFDLQDHLKTQKHKRSVAAMKAQMLQEDELLGGLSLNDNQVNSEAQPEFETEKKQGKAKKKAEKKKKGQHILTCGTCGQEFAGEELITHKKQTRHP